MLKEGLGELMHGITLVSRQAAKTLFLLSANFFGKANWRDLLKPMTQRRYGQRSVGSQKKMLGLAGNQQIARLKLL
jgi:hypothetical protein